MPSEAGLPTDSLTLVSFDPDMYNRLPRKRNPRNLYSDDLDRTVRALNNVKGGVLVQLSTYAANDSNPQGAVVSSVNSILVKGRFTLAAVVWAKRDKMSLVYARNVSWSAELAYLPGRFGRWFAAC